MTIWMSDPVEEMPEVLLRRWSIRETDSGARHFVGYNVRWREGRVSSEITSFDARTRSGVTQSGRLYRLVGRAGVDSDGEYVWNAVARLRGMESWRDVTAVLVPDWREPLSLEERIKQMEGSDSSESPNDSLM
jgi:hypothetical protein